MNKNTFGIMITEQLVADCKLPLFIDIHHQDTGKFTFVIKNKTGNVVVDTSLLTKE